MNVYHLFMDKPVHVLVSRGINNTLNPAYGRAQPNGDGYECRDCGCILRYIKGNTCRFCIRCGRLLVEPEICAQDDPEAAAEAAAIFDHPLEEAEACFKTIINITPQG